MKGIIVEKTIKKSGPLIYIKVSIKAVHEKKRPVTEASVEFNPHTKWMKTQQREVGLLLKAYRILAKILTYKYLITDSSGEIIGGFNHIEEVLMVCGSIEDIMVYDGEDISWGDKFAQDNTHNENNIPF